MPVAVNPLALILNVRDVPLSPNFTLAAGMVKAEPPMVTRMLPVGAMPLPPSFSTTPLPVTLKLPSLAWAASG